MAYPAVSGAVAPTVNPNPGLMLNYKAALLRGASDPARCLIFGDSNITGGAAGTGGPQLLTDAARLNWAKRFAALMGWQRSGFLGEQGALDTPGATVNAYDPRLVLGGNWTTSYPFVGLGGSWFRSSGVGGTLTFTPETAFDRFTVRYPIDPSGTTALQVRVDGALVATINQQSAAGYASTTVNTTLGTHVLTFSNAAAGTEAYLHGVQVTNSASSAPIFIPGGNSGKDLTTHVNADFGFSPRPILQHINPDFVLVASTINDLARLIPVADYSARLELIITAAPNASWAFMNCYPHAGVWQTDGSNERYADTLRALATDMGGLYIDARQVLGSTNARAAAKGFRYDDAHPNPAGHVALAQYCYDVLNPVMS